MWEWFQLNSGAISSVATLATLVVWIGYFQVLLNGYRHRMRPKILINRGGGRNIDARCVLSNMSAEPIYIEAILLSTKGDDDDQVCSLSDFEVRYPDQADQRVKLLQGPLESAEMVDIGSYREILEQVLASEGAEQGQYPPEFTITVVATYTAENALVAAERAFRIYEDKNKLRLYSPTVSARMIRSKRQRRRLQRLLEKDDLQRIKASGS
ncbi:hypothetical protein [Nitratireductor sp. CH_MIT9313-5]|uniref:hypothetical protein n=1 Tax=Nitratireductor sp. CH_MIT9313-5 TaxID=3107764 RepID=UPI00300A89B0